MNPEDIGLHRARAEDPKTSGFSHRRSEPPATDPNHARLDDWVGDSEESSDLGVEPSLIQRRRRRRRLRFPRFFGFFGAAGAAAGAGGTGGGGVQVPSFRPL